MKKFISILLAVMLVASLVVTASAYSVWPDAKTAEQGVKDYEEANGETVATNRYFFQMPNGNNGPLATKDVSYTETDDETGETYDVIVCHAGEHAPSWCNEYNNNGAVAGVYWWGGPATPDAWAGYQGMVEDAEQSIFYADVPAKTVVFIWNNGVDGGMDKTQEIYYKAQQTSDVACEYPDPGEYESIPDGADSFDGMIFIINPDEVSVNPLSLKQTCGGTWYFYYGDGCYGSYGEGLGDTTCKNPDHYDANGTHVGFVPAEPETEEPTTEPEPETEIPTTAPETEEPTIAPPTGLFRGDYDNDKDITILDATRAQNILAELVERPQEDFLANVDADGDGELTILDATRIQNFLAELCNMDGTKPFTPAA